MINIVGAFQVAPQSIGFDIAQAEAEDGSVERSTIMMMNTACGPVHIIIPVKNIDAVIDGLQKIKAKASSDLIVASNTEGVKEFAENQNAIKQQQ